MSRNHAAFVMFIKASLLLAAFLSALIPMPVAAEQGKILIVNSDATVEKYREVRDAFKSQLAASYTGRLIDFDAQSDDQGAALVKIIKDENPDLVFGIGSKAYQLAVQFAGDKPVLFSSVINWQRFGQHPHHYGITNELSLSQELSLLRFLLPGLNRVGVLYTPEFNNERIKEARVQIREVGLTLVEQPISSAGELNTLLEKMLPGIDVLWLIADPGVLADRASVENIFSRSNQYRKPVYTYSDAYTQYGAGLVASADTPTIGRQAATLAQSILAGDVIKEAVQTPAGSHISLNACQLDKLHTRYNNDALDAVNQLVECH